MSLLMATGHPEAGHYPLGFMWDEAAIVTERENARMIAESSLMDAVISSQFSKKAGEEKRKLVSNFNLEAKLRSN